MQPVFTYRGVRLFFFCLNHLVINWYLPIYKKEQKRKKYLKQMHSVTFQLSTYTTKNNKNNSIVLIRHISIK